MDPRTPASCSWHSYCPSGNQNGWVERIYFHGSRQIPNKLSFGFCCFLSPLNVGYNAQLSEFCYFIAHWWILPTHALMPFTGLWHFYWRVDLREDKHYLADHPGLVPVTTSQVRFLLSVNIIFPMVYIIPCCWLPFFVTQGEELRKQIGATYYIECSSKTQQVKYRLACIATRDFFIASLNWSSLWLLEM